MEEIEIWKSLDFLGYPDYEVSNYGNVKSFKLGKEKKLKFLYGSNEYSNVRLCKNNKVKSFTVHRLVALAFIPNPENLPCINHKDENKQNNHVSNLEWCTKRYNAIYNDAHIKKGEKQRGKPNYKNRKPILQYTKQGEFVKEWESAITASIELNINYSSIHQCCCNRIKSSGGYIWRYK